jgi:hypothetical protein
VSNVLDSRPSDLTARWGTGVDVEITVTVTDADGAPLEGVTPAIYLGGPANAVEPLDDAEADFTGTGGTDGVWTIAVPGQDSGSHRLRVTLDDEVVAVGFAEVGALGSRAPTTSLTIAGGSVNLALSVAAVVGGGGGGTVDTVARAAAAAAQDDIDDHAGLTTTAHGGIVASTDPRLTDARTPTTHSHPVGQIGTGTPAAGTYVDGATGAWTAIPSGGSVAWGDVTGKPDEFPPEDHDHAIADVTGLQTALDGKQPVDSDLTAIAALTTTAFGRGLLELANAGAALTALGAVPTSRTLAGLDLTANRSASDLRTALGLVIGTDVQAQDADLAAIAALTTTTFGRSLLEVASLAALQGSLGVPSNAPYIDGEYHVLARSVNLGSTAFPSSSSYVPGANTLTAQPVEVLAPVSIDGTYFFGQTSVASGIVRHGIYAASASTGLPTGNPLLTSPEFDMSSTGHKSATYTPVTLAAGRYWCVTAANLGTLGWRGPDVPMVDMGHTPGLTPTIRSFTASWTYSSSALPDVSAFSWSSSTSLAAPWIRWRTQL